MLQIDQYGNSSNADWDTDAATDACQEWRNDWADLLESNSPTITEYLVKREEWHKAMDWYHGQPSATGSPCLAVAFPVTLL